MGLTLVSESQSEVSSDRLRNANREPQNWLIHGGTCQALRYSPLDQIDTTNVHRLSVAWAFQLGVVENGLQSTPLVADGVMYVIGSGMRVFALDATNGKPLWSYFYVPRRGTSPARGCQSGSCAG